MLVGRNHLAEKSAHVTAGQGAESRQAWPQQLSTKVALKKQQDSTVWSLSQKSRVRKAAVQQRQAQDLASTSS